MICLGIDIGTQSLKVVLVEDAQRLLASATSSYGVTHPSPGFAEQAPALWEAALGQAVPEALTRAGISSKKVDAIGIAGQLDGCVAVDAEGDALSPCLLWMDRRASAELPHFDVDAFRAQTGLIPDASHMAPKIAYLRARGFADARFHQPTSYLVERLCGSGVLDHALASTTMLYDLQRRDYAAELLEAFSIPREALPAIASADSLAGRLHAEGARLCGLLEGTPLAVGTGDDFATPLGAGLVAPGPMVCVLGTAEVCGAVSDSALIDARGMVETHEYLGRYFIENPGWLSGGAIAWCRELLGVQSDAKLDALAEQAPPGCNGLSFLPALTGTMAPEWHSEARACFYGLTPSHGPPEMARAVLEGCSFAMRDVRSRLQELGLAPDEILLLGGGARSELWAQIRADVCQARVLQDQESNSCAIGASFLAASALEKDTELASIASRWPHERRAFSPQPEKRAIYDRAYDRYLRLFEALRPLYSTNSLDA